MLALAWLLLSSALAAPVSGEAPADAPDHGEEDRERDVEEDGAEASSGAGDAQHAEDGDEDGAEATDRGDESGSAAAEERRHAADDPRRGLEPHPHDPVGGPSDETLEVHAWARGGYRVEAHDAAVGHRPYLSLARLQVGLSDGQKFSAFVQLGADNGLLGLLDAIATAHVGEDFEFAVGRMKVPVSHDWLVPASQMLVPTRALLDGFAPLRAVGLQARWHHDGEHVSPTLRVGVFDPLRPGSTALGGAQLVVQGGLHTHGGLVLHLAGASWLHSKDALERFGEDATEWDRQLDLAVGYDHDRWTLEVEGLTARTLDGGQWQWGTTLMAAHRIPLHDEDMVLEPVVAWDVRTADDTFQRVTTAVNLHEDGWHLVQSLAWEMEIEPHGPPGHTFLVQVQAGL